MKTKTYRPGDIVGITPTSLIPVMGSYFSSKLLNPSTPLFHFLVIGRKIPREDDYEIYESISKGVSIGRLSWYNDSSYVVFRPSKGDGNKAILQVSKFGRTKYDYLLIAKLFLGVVKCWFVQLREEHKLRKIEVEEIPYAQDDQFICTELANAVWRSIDFPLIPKGVVPIPASFARAHQQGKMPVIGINMPASIQK